MNFNDKYPDALKPLHKLEVRKPQEVQPGIEYAGAHYDCWTCKRLTGFRYTEEMIPICSDECLERFHVQAIEVLLENWNEEAV